MKIKPGKNFLSDTNGAVALIVGIALTLVLIAILSLAIDLNRTQDSHVKGQGATDAAAAGVAELWLKAITNQIGIAPAPFTTPIPADAQNYGQTIFEQNFSRDQSSAFLDTSNFTVTPNMTGPDGNGNYLYTVAVHACANLSTPIAAAAGHTTGNTNCADGAANIKSGACMRTCTDSTAQFGLTVLQNLEVAFALDFTNSMFWHGDQDIANVPYTQTKAYNLVTAMNNTLNNDAFFPKTNSTVWASIVPFSSIVNIYPYNNDFISDPEPLIKTTSVKGINSSSASNKAPFYAFNDNSADPTQPSYLGSTETRFFTDYNMAEDFTSGTPQYNNASYYDKVLDRVPTIDGPSFSHILSDGNDSAGTKFSSYRKVYNLLAATSPDIARNVCYNADLVATLDQRIEKDFTPNSGDTTHLANGLVAIENQPELPNTNGTPSSCNNLPCDDNNMQYTAYESFPIQPLTTNTAILKDVVNRFVATSQLYPSSISANTLDRQSSPLTKASGWSAWLGTSGVHGMLWAWFTIDNHWQNLWSRPSVHETYFTADSSGSVASRSGLPAANHRKHIIFMTDGHDNDGNGAGAVCDAYSPTGTFATKDYKALCQKIKDEGIIIHVLLLDFNNTDSTTRFNGDQQDSDGYGCSSPHEFYNNVTPDQIQTIMTNIFRSIITGVATVSLSK